MDRFWLELTQDHLVDGSWQESIDSARSVCLHYGDDLVGDISAICDHMLHRYEKGGYTGVVCVSLPYIASENSKKIAKKAKDIYNRIDRENLMIGIIADEAGIEAASILVSDGISVNMMKLFSPIRAQQAAEAIISNAKPNSTNLLTVSVGPYDAYLNEQLKKHGLAQNRIGFFVATKIYNQTEDKDSDAFRVMFADMTKVDPQLSDTYYIENLNLPGVEMLLGTELFETAKDRAFEESFHFQSRHLDAFFGFLAPASISIQDTEQKLFEEATQ